MSRSLHSLSVGDIACARKLGPHTRGLDWNKFQDLLFDATVTKIGHKYVTVKIGVECQFEKDTGSQKDTGYSADYVLFSSREEAVEQAKQEFLFWGLRTQLERLTWGLYTAENSVRNIPVSDWETAARLFGVDIPWAAEQEEKPLCMELNAFANRCGYFHNAFLTDDISANNGYNCRHKEQQERFTDPDSGKCVGCCNSWSCPLGYAPSAKEAAELGVIEASELDDYLGDDESLVDYIIVTDPELREKLRGQGL